ncbi:hypothetical protein COTS27_01181 [Spirochaetota bacterium]|nr:hypothetical protein COTS27_01181 [Spirochaetota bacterium]
MKRKIERTLLHQVLAPVLMGVLLLTGSVVWAFDEVSLARSPQGYAVSGYDTVAYFTEKKPVRGNEKYKHTWKNATWVFASEEHLKLFKANPEKYAPQYGGHCAWGIGGKSALFSSDPAAWEIIDGKLYLNYNPSVRNTWLRNTGKYIKNGDVVWKNLLKKNKKDS